MRINLQEKKFASSVAQNISVAIRFVFISLIFFINTAQTFAQKSDANSTNGNEFDSLKKRIIFFNHNPATYQNDTGRINTLND